MCQINIESLGRKLDVYTGHLSVKSSKFLDSLFSCLRSISEIQDDGQVVMVNFKNLLQFWRSHYTLPTKRMDRKNLELVRSARLEQLPTFNRIVVRRSCPGFSMRAVHENVPPWSISDVLENPKEKRPFLHHIESGC